MNTLLRIFTNHRGERRNPHRHNNKRTRKLRGLGNMATNLVGKLDGRCGPRAGV